MSWGFEMTGTRDAVKAAVTEQMTKIAASYEGKPEAADALACRDRVLALVDACDLTRDIYGVEWNAVIVKAGGSHAWSGEPSGTKLTNASFQVSVTRTSLKL